MIKINLNRTRVDNGGEGTAVQTVSSDANPRELVVKILVMFIGVVALSLYQKQNLDQLDAQLAIVQSQVNKVKGELEQKKTELAALKDIEPQSQALADKLKVLRELSKLRLFQLQSLDYIQSIIPDKVWLQTIDYETNNYRIFGNSVETTDLTEFVHKLEGSAYFQDVIVVQDLEKLMAGNLKVRDFELTSRSEVKN
jgi:Tfp pilus assembly protein PilN